MESGHTPSRKYPEYWGGDIPWISIGDAKLHHGRTIDTTIETTNALGITNSSSRVLPANTVCVSRTASVGYVVVIARPMATSQDFVNWVCSPELDPNFLKYLFLAEGESLLRFASGSVHQTIYFPEAKAFHICYPPLPEQQRIVGILDEAFAGIATAKANAEKNLRNARVLFESDLLAVFSKRGEGWCEKVLSEICGISASLVDPRGADFIDMRHVGGANIETRTGALIDLKTAREESLKSGKFVFDESMVLYSKIRPYLMKVARPDFRGLCSADIYPLVPNAGQIDRNYLFHLLLSPSFTEYAIKGSARAGMPKVNRKHLFAYRVHLPSLVKQKEYAAKLDLLAFETRRLESLYQQKLAALDALKKSLLHQAFSGQLTADDHAITMHFPVAIPNISTTDLHAGILAMACDRHELAGKLGEFTHVKAEKIAHMVEARLGLDLGRNPVKDAAGPNDFNHLRKLEHRAKMANFFDFKQIAGGAYRVQKLRGFDRLIDKTRTALGERLSEVERLLQWMLPMKVRQAEIVATVYAAWNNLLLDGKKPTDEEIVYESRENWHPDKLKIERWRFAKAVGWLRKEGIVPEGKGKRVGAKGK